MSFSEQTIKDIWKEQNGKCAKCKVTLNFSNRGRPETTKERLQNTVDPYWETHHKNPIENGGTDNKSNCQILCWNCHQKTF